MRPRFAGARTVVTAGIIADDGTFPELLAEWPETTQRILFTGPGCEAPLPARTFMHSIGENF